MCFDSVAAAFNVVLEVGPEAFELAAQFVDAFVDISPELVDLLTNHILCCGVCGFVTTGRTIDWVVANIISASIRIILMNRKLNHALGVRVLVLFFCCLGRAGSCTNFFFFVIAAVAPGESEHATI